MANDIFARNSDSPSGPARRCFAVSPHDSDLLPVLTKAIYVGTGGDIVLRAAEDDADATFRSVPAGAILDVRVCAIRATGTTASDIVGLA